MRDPRYYTKRDARLSRQGYFMDSYSVAVDVGGADAKGIDVTVSDQALREFKLNIHIANPHCS